MSYPTPKKSLLVCILKRVLTDEEFNDLIEKYNKGKQMTTFDLESYVPNTDDKLCYSRWIDGDMKLFDAAKIMNCGLSTAIKRFDVIANERANKIERER